MDYELQLTRISYLIGTEKNNNKKTEKERLARTCRKDIIQNVWL